MTELSRSLLAAAREGLAPDAAVAARVRAKVAAAVAAGATGATGAATALRAPATKAATTSSVLLEVAAVLVTVGVVAGLVVVAGPRERTPEAPQLAVPVSEPDDLRADVRVTACNDVDDPRVARPAPMHSRPAPAASPDVADHARSSVPARADGAADTAAPAPEPVSLSREVELIDLAMVSLRKHAPRAAIEAIRVFERETLGRGQMAEEAAAIAIEAHCRLGDDVTDALAEFDREWPSSAQRERLQTACFSKH